MKNYKNKLKILLLNDYAFIEGGAGKVAIESAVSISKKGHEVIFFAAVGPIGKELSRVALKEIICLNQQDILSNINKINAMFYGILNKNAIKELLSLFERWRPDIAHVHGVSKALSWAVIGLLYRKRIPVIYTLHDFGLLCPNMGLYNFKNDNQCELYKSMTYFKCLFTNCDKRSYPQKIWRWFRFIYTRKILQVLKKINGFIAVSNFEADFIRKYLPNKSKLKVINNPVSEELYKFGIKKKFKQLDLSLKKNPQFLYIGRLSVEKGIDLLLSAIKKVDANLIIVGEGELFDLCNKAANEIGNDRIKIFSRQDEERLAEIMVGSDVIISPSRVLETAGIVVIEASKYGLPAIVPDQGGLKEFIVDNINGLYFKHGNLDSLIEAMQIFVYDPSLSYRLGKNAKFYFEKNKDKFSNYIDNLINFYYEIIEAVSYLNN